MKTMHKVMVIALGSIALSGCSSTSETCGCETLITTFTAEPSAHQVVPENKFSEAYGNFTWVVDETVSDYTLTIHGFDLEDKTSAPTPRGDAYLRCADPAETGPVVYTLANDLNDWDRGSDGSFTVTGVMVEEGVNPVSGYVACGRDIASLADVVYAIHDGNIYVDVPSFENPGGEIRGLVVDVNK